MVEWDINKIKEVLPHRFPFLFIDRVLEVDISQRKAVCLKNVSINDYFFEGHFPQHPVMPGVLIIEAMAQSSIILFASLKPEIAKLKPDYYLGKVEAKFLKPVNVGDVLILEAEGEKILDNVGIVKAEAKVNNESVAQAKLTFAVKINK